MKFYWFLFLIVFLLIQSESLSQQVALPDHYLQHYTDENGLPQNSIKAIVKDTRGFIWLATEDGLVRFDGQRFYTFNRTKLPLSSNRIHDFMPTVGSYNFRNRQFHAVSENMEYIRILANGSVAVDDTYHPQLLQNAPYVKESLGKLNIMGSLPLRFPQDSKHKPYLVPAGDNKYYVWFYDRIECYHKRTKLYTIKLNAKYFFLIDSHAYAIFKNGEFIKIKPDSTNTEVDLKASIKKDLSASENQPNFELFWNNISQQAFLYLNQKFYFLHESNDGKGLVTELILSGLNFEELKIRTAYYDQESHYLFLGSFTKGLFVLKHKAFQTFRRTEKDADNVYYSQVAVASNSVLTAQGYSFSLDHKIPADVTTHGSVLMRKINFKNFMAPDSDSTFWMGLDYDLLKFDRTGTKILTRYKLDDQFKALYIDKEKRLWLGGPDSLLFCLNTRDPIAKPQKVARNLLSEITYMQLETPDILLLCTLKGLYRFHIKSARLESVKGFEDIHVRSCYVTSDGIWITTYGNGFYLLSHKKLVKFPLDKDQLLATSHCIVEDAKGYLWITTNKGLFQVAKQDLVNFAANKQSNVFYMYYDKRQGFETNEFNGGCQPCAVRLSNGRISLPSMDGIVSFYPDKIKTEFPDKGLFISKAELNGHTIPVKEQMIIPRDFERLRLYVTTPYFGNSKNIQINYALTKNGSDPVWLPIADDFVVPLSKSPSGDYTLTIRKANGFGADNYVYKSIKLHIPPAWYETWWFRGAFMILILLLFQVILSKRTKYLLEKERDIALRRHYRVSNQIVTAINHDIQTPLHYVTTSLRQVYSLLLKENNENHATTQISKEILDTTERISTLTKNLLNYIKLQSGKTSANPHITEVNVQEIVRQICLLFSGVASFNQIQIINLIDRPFLVRSDGKLLSIILHNLMDNAMKVSSVDVTISTAVENGEKHIIIKDSGNGMPEGLVKWLNKIHKSYDEWILASEYPNQNGVGLIIVKDLCTLLGIRIAATGIPGEETSVRLVFEDNCSAVN